MVRKILAALALLLGAASCSTPYQEAGFFSMRGGYSEKEIEPGIWRVTFTGNGFTSRETAQTYWLYRSAELTLAHGYDGFEILSDMRFLSPGRPPLPIVHVAAPVYVPMYMDSLSKPTVEGDIRMLKKPFEPAPPKRFDAAALKEAVSPYIAGSCGSGNVCPHVHRYLMPKDQASSQGS